MKTPRFLSGLSRSTIITIIACACFLAMVGMVLLFFMMFPIDLQKNSMQLSAEETTTTVTQPADESSVPEETVVSEGDPELSTWEAAIDGETKPIYEHFGDSRPDDEPSDETEFYQTDVPEETQIAEMTSESVSDTVDPMQTTDATLETAAFSSDAGESAQTTYTETVPMETLPQPTQPVVVPDPTDPPAPEATAAVE